MLHGLTRNGIRFSFMLRDELDRLLEDTTLLTIAFAIALAGRYTSWRAALQLSSTALPFISRPPMRMVSAADTAGAVV